MIRALQGWGIFLVRCEVSDTAVKADIALIDIDDPPPQPEVDVFDVDTGEQYRIISPETFAPFRTRVELIRAAV